MNKQLVSLLNPLLHKNRSGPLVCLFPENLVYNEAVTYSNLGTLLKGITVEFVGGEHG